MSHTPRPLDRRIGVRPSAFRRWYRPHRAALAARVLLASAGLLLASSLTLPYWLIELTTANHPQGLLLHAYLGHFEGLPRDAGLALLERSQEVAAATVLLLLVLAAAFARHRWAGLLGLPAIAFPLAVAADLAGWLPAALCALGERELGCAGGVVPFWGRLELEGQLLVARPASGLALAAAAAALVFAAGVWRAGAGVWRAAPGRAPSSPPG